MDDRSLGLPEELMLLALDERTGSVVSAAALALPYALAGAALLELVLAGRARLEGGRLAPLPGERVRDEVLDEVLATLLAAKRPHTLEQWVGRFGASPGRLRAAVLKRLVLRGILRDEEGRVLGVFPVRRHPESDGRPERELRARLRRVVVEGASPDARTSALIALAHACELGGVLFEKGERRAAVARMKTIAHDQPVGGAVADAVVAVRVATLAAIGAMGS